MVLQRFLFGVRKPIKNVVIEDLRADMVVCKHEAAFLPANLSLRDNSSSLHTAAFSDRFLLRQENNKARLACRQVIKERTADVIDSRRSQVHQPKSSRTTATLGWPFARHAHNRAYGIPIDLVQTFEGFKTLTFRYSIAKSEELST